MKIKDNWKKYVVFLLLFAFLSGNMAGGGMSTVSAASNKKIRSVKITQAGKNVTKKTLKMEKGKTKKLKVKVKPSLSKRYIKFRSSDKKVVSVDKNGRLKAKKAGSARITVTVSRKGYKKKTSWVNITVGETKSPVPGTPAVPETPGQTPDETPDQTPGETPGETPGQIPGETPDQTPGGAGSDDTDSGKLLVAYFSWSGTSERIAQNIISQTGADSFRIERSTPYSTDYNEVAYGEAKTEADNNARPPIKDPLASVSQYDKIVVCYPIWWHTAPMTVGTFLENYDLTGKKIYPVSQSASMDTSQYRQSVAFIRDCAKGAEVDDGLFTKDNSAVRDYIENTVLK